MGMSGQLEKGLQIDGATDGTSIGNEADRLKVAVSFSSPTAAVPSWSNKLRYIDMNATSGGIARGTALTVAAGWTTTFQYTGSGFIAGLIVNVETFTGWEFRLIVDGNTIFSFLDTDLTTDTIYDVDDVADSNQLVLGVSKGSHDRFTWHSPLGVPLYYGSSVQVQIRRASGASKKFQAGLIILSKDT